MAERHARPALRLTVQDASGRPRSSLSSASPTLPARSTLRRWLLRALAGARRPAAVLTVRFVGTAEGRRLNREFRHRDHATNVLSFALDGPFGHGVSRPLQIPASIRGDIVLCVPVLVRESRAQGKSLRAHCAHLVIHGTLHLCGYDHETAKGAKVMEALETGLLESLGYDDPYATKGEPASRIR